MAHVRQDIFAVEQAGPRPLRGPTAVAETGGHSGCRCFSIFRQTGIFFRAFEDRTHERHQSLDRKRL